MIRFSKGLKIKHGMVVTLDQDLVKAKPLIQLLQELLEAETQEKKDNLEKLIGTMYGHFERPEWDRIKKYRLRGWIIEHSNLTWDELTDKLTDKLTEEITRLEVKKHDQTKKQTLPQNPGRIPCLLRPRRNDKGRNRLDPVPV